MYKNILKNTLFSCLIFGCFVVPVWSALNLPEAPNTYVLDEANILSDESENVLINQLKSLEEFNSSEIAIVTVSSLQGYAIEEFSIELARKWGIGQKEHDNGLLFLIAPNDRQMRIEVGYGLEGAIPDIAAHYIIEDIKPYFKEGDFEGGIAFGVSKLDSLARGEVFDEKDYIALDSPSSLNTLGSQEETDFDLWQIIKELGVQGMLIILGFLFIPFLWLFTIFRQSKSWIFGGVFCGGLAWIISSQSWVYAIIGAAIGLGLDYIASTYFYKKYVNNHKGGDSWWTSSGSSGSSGSGSSGSSGSSFGGGSFGGGGSSGSW